MENSNSSPVANINSNNCRNYGFKELPENKSFGCKHCNQVLMNPTTSDMLEHRNVCKIDKDSNIKAKAKQNRTAADSKSSIQKLKTNQTLDDDDITFNRLNCNSSTDNSNPLSPSLERTLYNALDEDEDNIEMFNFQSELQNIQNLFSNPKQIKLQEDLTKATAQYYHVRALYFAKLKENSKMKRAVMLLQARKMQLEIEKLRSDF